jgi:hypothetical protein
MCTRREHDDELRRCTEQGQRTPLQIQGIRPEQPANHSSLLTNDNISQRNMAALIAAIYHNVHIRMIWQKNNGPTEKQIIIGHSVRKGLGCTHHSDRHMITTSRATTVGGAKLLQQGNQSDYSRGSEATTAGGAKRLQQGSEATSAGGAKRLQRGSEATSQGERSNFSRE